MKHSQITTHSLEELPMLVYRGIVLVLVQYVLCGGLILVLKSND